MSNGKLIIDTLLLTCPRVFTHAADGATTNASGFLFERDERLFLVTSRHVVVQEQMNHRPERLEIEIHTDADNLAVAETVAIPLYEDGLSSWRDARDTAGEIDVAVVEIDRSLLPRNALFCAFTPLHLMGPEEDVEIGSALLTVGYPLGFDDSLHHLPVARQASLASAFGLRFKGKGFFMVDAWTHRGISGAPVVMRADSTPKEGSVPWRLLGVHSARLESETRDPALDEVLGLNAVWYADVIMTLTEPR